MPSRMIWQYWETIGDKPAFVDGLHAIAKRNAGAEIILVTPETLREFLPDLPAKVFEIGEIAHKADMIRAMLVMRHGGMWLDSDAIVLRRLDWMLDLLKEYEFVGFNDDGSIKQRHSGKVKVNCFASRVGGSIVSEWVRLQHAKLPRTEYHWTEIGTDLLDPVCLESDGLVKMLPFPAICPVPWDHVALFTSREINASAILRECHAVMLSNQSMKSRAPSLRTLTVEQIARGDYLLSAIMRHAMETADMKW